MHRKLLTVGLVLFLSACGLKPLVGTSEAVTADSEYAYILVGIDSRIDCSIESEWAMAWIRDSEDVTYGKWAVPNVYDSLRASSSTPIAGDAFEGVTFFLRKQRPGDYKLMELARRIHADWAITTPQDNRLHFTVNRGEVSYIGTFTLDAHPSRCPIPVDYRVESEKARRYLERFTAISVPVTDVPVSDPVELDSLSCEYKAYRTFLF